MTTSYVIACWMGERQNEDPRQVEDRAFFLKTHIRRLSELSHDLSQITIVLARGGDEEAEAYACSLATDDVVVLTRRNECYSYGSWEDAFLADPDFDHFIFVEDDYIPCLDNFDRSLVEICDSKETYVCSLTAWKKTHAAISNSVCPRHILERLFPSIPDEMVGKIPKPGDGFYSQLTWSRFFYEAGYTIDDWTESFSSPFWNGWELRWYGHPSLPSLFVPIQATGRIVSIADGVSCRLRAVLAENGTVSPVSSDDMTMWDEFLSRGLDDSRWRFPPILSKPFYWHPEAD